MGVAQDINKLRGQKVKRDTVKVLLASARAEEQDHIAAALEHALRANPRQAVFQFSPDKSAIERVPESMLHGLHQEYDKDGKIHGLGKAVTPDQIYQMITNKMIDLVAKANEKDYKATWKKKGYLVPFNFVSKKRYRGINAVMLTEFGMLQNPFFLTFNQIEELGGTLKKGSHGWPVVYFTYLHKYEDTEKGIDIASYDKEKFTKQLTDAGVTDSTGTRLPILKYYNVFNGADIEGINFNLDTFKIGYVDNDVPANEDNRLEVPEAIVKHYPSPAPRIIHGGSEAFYMRGTDSVTMPEFADFATAQDYYRTLFHELGHSTGSPDRLARTKGKKFGDKDYAFEELVAEFCATFVSAEAGIIWHTNANHAAYLKNWNRALTFLKDDNRFLMRAATLAQAAADFMLNPDKEGNPAYMVELEKKTEEKPEKASEFILPELPEKYHHAIYNSSHNELKHFAASSEYPLNVAAKNMLDLISGKFFVLLYFKEGYGREAKKPEYRNVPVVYKKLLKKDIADLSDEQLLYLLDKFKEYSYETAWHGYSFNNVDSVTIHKIVQANIRLLEKLVPSQLELQLNGKRGLNAPSPVPQPEPKQTDEYEIEYQEPEEIEVNEPEEVDETPVAEPEPVQAARPAKPVGDNPLLLSSKQLMSMHFETLKFTGKWKGLMQEPAKNMKIAIWGKPKNGKTSGACAFAEYLTQYGNVLYNFADQGINKSTQDIWRNSGLDDNDHAFPTGANTLDQLETLVASGDFDFVFIDMINHYIDNEKLKPHEFKERFIQKYPDISFILVMEVTKSGNFKGDQGWTHIVDALVTVENFLMECRGRYGHGHYVVWEQGLKDNDPDKYDEIFAEEPQALPVAAAAPVVTGSDMLSRLNFTIS